MYFGLFITLNYARYIHHLMRKINDLYFYILVAIDMDQRKQEIRTPSHTYMFLSLQVKICCSQQNAKNSLSIQFLTLYFIDSYFKNKDYRIEICAQ